MKKALLAFTIFGLSNNALATPIADPCMAMYKKAVIQKALDSYTVDNFKDVKDITFDEIKTAPADWNAHYIAYVSFFDAKGQPLITNSFKIKVTSGENCKAKVTLQAD